MHENTIPLSQIPVGTSALIVNINAEPEVKLRLQELGFALNTVVQPILYSGKRMICEIHSTRIGLHTSIADTIQVVPLTSD